ncbi:MAG: 2-hydroxyglutaryl-CoA dehydratase, partial [Limisphaerales bacterium]
EGAEVEIQLVVAWLLYMLWTARYDTRERMHLRREDEGGSGLKGVNPQKKLAMLWAADKFVRSLFTSYASILGLKNY